MDTEFIMRSSAVSSPKHNPIEANNEQKTLDTEDPTKSKLYFTGASQVASFARLQKTRSPCQFAWG